MFPAVAIRRIAFAFSFFAALAAPAAAAAATLHVDDDATAANPDGTTQNPYKTVQAAVAAAADGDTIQVAKGLYGAVSLSNKEVYLYGGYAGAGDFSEATRDPGANATFVEGDASTPAFTLFDAKQSIVDGFVVTNSRHGFVVDSDDFTNSQPTLAAPIIRGNLIERNGNATETGGGLALDHCNAQIVNNVIRQNDGRRGAAISSDCWTLVISGNQITDNVGHEDHAGGLNLTGHVTVHANFIKGNRIGDSLGYGWGGGALAYNQGTVAHFSYNIWTANHAPSIGAALFVDDGAVATVDHDIFYAQDCADEGGQGVYVDGYSNTIGSMVTLTNVTIAGNHCTNANGGGAVYVERVSHVDVISSILWDNGADELHTDDTSSISVTYSDVHQATPGAGNINADPLFFAPASGDFHEKSTAGRFDPVTRTWVTDAVMSPAIDKGDPGGDYSMEPGPNGERINMGAYGGTPEASMGGPGGTPPSDAGPGPDANAFDDGGYGYRPDGGANGDAGSGGGGGGSCGCRSGGRPTTPAALLFALPLVAGRARRARRRRP
jgi:hypothetical protein